MKKISQEILDGVVTERYMDTNGFIHIVNRQDVQSHLDMCRDLSMDHGSQKSGDRILKGGAKHVAEFPTTVVYDYMKKRGIDNIEEAVQAMLLDDSYSSFRTNSKSNQVFVWKPTNH